MTETGATGPLAALTPARVATLALDRAIRTAALYEGKGALCADTVAAALRALHDLRGDRSAVRISVLPTGLAVEGDLDPDAETRSASFQIFRDGLRALHLSDALDEAALEALVHILADPFQRWGTQQGDDGETRTTDRDEDTVTRLWEADLAGVSVEAVEAYAERELALDGERRSVEDWVAVRRAALLAPADAPAADPTPLTVAPLARLATLPRDARDAHRALEATDARHDRARRLVVLSRPAALAQPGSTAALVAACLDCLRADGWAALALALRIAEEQATAAAWDALVRALQADEHRQAFDHALQRMHAPDAAPVVQVLQQLGLDPAQRAGPLLTDHARRPAVEALETALDEAGLPAAALFAPLLDEAPPLAAWAVEHLGARHQRTPPDPQATAALRAVLAHRHPGTRLLAFRALDGDRHPDTHAALLETLGADDRGLLQHCRPQIAALVTDPQTADGATVSLLQVVEHPQFWDRPAPVRRLVLGLLAESTSADATAWLDAFLGRTAVFFGRAALREKQDLVKRVVAQHRRAP